MADIDRRLKEELRKLNEELEEGDITRKGYEKRRTQILSQYIAPQHTPSGPRGGLRIHSPDDSDHPASKDGSRSASLAALTAGSSMITSRNSTMTKNHPGLSRQLTVVKDEIPAGNGTLRSSSPQGLVQRFQEREAGSLMSMPRSSSSQSYESWHATLTVDSSSPDVSRSQTLV